MMDATDEVKSPESSVTGVFGPMASSPGQEVLSFDEEQSQFEINPIEPGKVKIFETTATASDDTMTQHSADLFMTSTKEEEDHEEPPVEEEQMQDINLDEEPLQEMPEERQTPFEEEKLQEEPVDEDDGTMPQFETPVGTILEAAFVDPAYSWPPKDGEGRNAIELQASLQLLNDPAEPLDTETESITTTTSMKRRMRVPREPKPPKAKWWQCCRNNHAVDPETMRVYHERTIMAKEARREHADTKREHLRQKEKEHRKKHRYNRIPEGILIYRLDTSTHELSLMSDPHSNTNLDTLVREMIVCKAVPSPDKSRRGMVLTGADGLEVTLVACEQRTATAWLEAMNLMLASNKNSKWSSQKLNKEELTNFEDQYMNLAGYSHNLIRAGALPGGKKGSGGAGGIYYSIEKVAPGLDDEEEEALEVIAKRRAVIKDSWDFFRMICSLLRDRNKYQEVFRRMQLDPVYPYLNSMTGLNDPGDAGYENPDKAVTQKAYPEYSSMSNMGLARTMIAKAEAALPSLVEICKALAGSLGMEEVGVGPIKEVDSAVRKAEKKYNGDLLKITDYCRALLVVKDFPSLLALLELARDSFGPLIRRVKMSSLKADHDAKPGGYRDCIINVELKDHVCEIQVHIWPMWVVCGVDGFRHYRHCVEYKTDSFSDAYDALDGLDRKTMAELIVMAEEAVAETPLDNLEWYHEKFILDYFAEAGLFLKHGLDVWAEIIFRHLIRLRTESPDIGPDHHETVILHKYLAQSLRAQGKYEEADQVMLKVQAAEVLKSNEKAEAERSLWDCFVNAPQDAYDFVVDPNKKEREEEAKLRKEVKQSKKRWRKIRQERFAFLDSDMAAAKAEESVRETAEEKKVDPAE